MRYVLAFLALAASGVLLLLGIGQRTFLAGPAEIVYPVHTEENSNYAVIAGDEFSQVPGQANLVMKDADSFAAIAKTRDIEGWITPFAHEVVTVDADSRSIQSRAIRADTPVSDLLEVDEDGVAIPLDPRGSDLWLETVSAEVENVRLPVALTSNQSVLIAGSDGGPLPNNISIVWVQDRATPWAGPLLAAGGAFALVGAVLYLLAFDRDKRALGPRRGRKGPLLGVRNTLTRGKLRRAKVDDSARVTGAYSDSPEAIARLENSSETGAETATEGTEGDEHANK